MNKKALRDLSYGVYVVSSSLDGRDCGCVANSAMQVSSSPATIAVSLNHDNLTNEAVAKSGMFALSILPEDVDPSVIGTFGFKSSRDTDKFAEVSAEEKLAFYTDYEIKAILEEAKNIFGESGRLIARPSGTEPLIRVMAEGEDNELVRRVAEETASRIKQQLESYR